MTWQIQGGRKGMFNFLDIATIFVIAIGLVIIAMFAVYYRQIDAWYSRLPKFTKICFWGINVGLLLLLAGYGMLDDEFVQQNITYPSSIWTGWIVISLSVLAFVLDLFLDRGTKRPAKGQK